MAKTYLRKLSDPRWQKKRLKILERDKWTCKKCGDTETELHVHHLEYHKDPWNTPDKLLITLCAHCHQIIEDIKEFENLSKIPFDKIKIYKSDNWGNGNRIMFVRIDESLVMSVFDKENDFIVGFDLPEREYAKIRKLMYKN